MNAFLFTLGLGMIIGCTVTLMIIGLLFVSHEIEVIISGTRKIARDLKCGRTSEVTDGKVAR